MAKTNLLVAKLRTSFPQITFLKSDDFYWSPRTKTVHFAATEVSSSVAYLLHETAHALLEHAQYKRDIDLLRLEREAWDYATNTLGPQFDITIDGELIEDMIDTYRNWLHARSTCPACSLTGVQSSDHTYHCVGCSHDWKVNDARRCGLKRYSIPK